MSLRPEKRKKEEQSFKTHQPGTSINGMRPVIHNVCFRSATLSASHCTLSSSIVKVCGRTASAPLRVFGQGLSSQKGRTKIKGRSHKQEHAGTQT